MDNGEGGRGRDGERDGAEETKLHSSPKPSAQTLMILGGVPNEGLSSHTSAPAPAKEPPTQTELGGVEGTAGREVTPGGEGGERGGRSHEGSMEEEDGKPADKDRLLLEDNREAAVRGGSAAPALSSRDPGEEDMEWHETEDEKEEVISNQSQTKSKCSVLPRQSQHSSAFSPGMTNCTLNSNSHISPASSPKCSTSPKLSVTLKLSDAPKLFDAVKSSDAPKLSDAPTLSNAPKLFDALKLSEAPKLSNSPMLSDALKLYDAPSTSPELSNPPTNFPKHSRSSSSTSSSQSEAEVRDQGAEQSRSPGVPLSFNKPLSALTEYDVKTDTIYTSLIVNGENANVPKPNKNLEEKDGEGDEEMEKEGEEEGDGEREGDENVDTVSKYHQPSSSCPSSPSSPGSLNSHMALLHSRNSCKTLKCPKCNWHYKSQQTLQTHLREKHPESGGLCVCGGLGEKCVCGESRDVCVYCSSGKAHPRLSRGETYVCGYKPYRCGVCDYATSSKGNLSIHMQSDKHLSNVQAAGQAVHSIHLSPTVSQPPALIAPNPSQTQSQGKRWRCEVCDYETSIARNLRIHTTSEKHTHNVLRLKHTHNVLRLKHTHNVLQLQRSYYLAHCRSLPAQLPSLHSPGMEKSTDMHQLTAVEPVAPESTLTPSPSPPPSSSSPSPSPSPSPSLSPPPSSSLSPGVFQCLVCSSFSSDSLESLGSHLGTPRSLPQSEWRCLVGGGCYCRLCGYSTPLRANFSLHCQTDRHRARYQLAAHLWEGGEKGEAVDWEKIGKLVATGNPVQLRCNMCEFQTSSLDNLKAHSMNAQHLSSLKVYRFLQQYDSAVDTESWSFHCILCNYSSRSKLHLLRHNHSLGHQKKAELHKLPVLDGRSLEEEEELAATFTIQKILIPETDGSSEEEWERKDSPSPAKRTFSGLMEIQSSLSPKRPRTDPQATPLEATAKCPLCQNTLEHKRLRHHLTHTHSVAQDCVDKLMSVVNVRACVCG